MANLIRRIHRALRNYSFQLFSAFVSSALIPNPLRPALLRFVGVRIGKGSHLAPHCSYKFGSISIGDLFVCGTGVYLDGSGSISIGNRVHLGPFSKVMTATHSIMPSPFRRDKSETILADTIIGDGCWIGLGSTIIAGVEIGRGCVIAAGSVVNRSCQPNGLYAGVPAKRIKELPVDSELPFVNGIPIEASHPEYEAKYISIPNIVPNRRTQ